MSGIIPKEQLANVQRWQIGAFDAPKVGRPQMQESEPVSKPAPEPEPPAPEAPIGMGLPTAENIAQIEDEARQNGHQAGYQAGYDEGLKAAEQAAQAAQAAQLEQLAGMISSLQNSLKTIDQTVADQLLKLAVEIAAQIICGALAVKDDFLLPIIREAITALPLHHGHAQLRINPADAVTIRAQLGEQFAQTGIQIVEDSEISPGGCNLRAGTSEVDASIETRWKRVLESIGAEPTPWLTR